MNLQVLTHCRTIELFCSIWIFAKKNDFLVKIVSNSDISIFAPKMVIFAVINEKLNFWRKNSNTDWDIFRVEKKLNFAAV